MDVVSERSVIGSDQGSSTEELHFVATVSHELRGPLHAILGLSELLLEAKIRKEDRRLLESLNREAVSLQILIDDILDYSRLRSEKLELSAQGFSPSRLVADLVETTRVSASKKGLRLILEVDPVVPHQVVGDTVRFGQVVRNLLTNAVRYTDEGSINVRVYVDERGLLCCSVSDTGIGIAPDKLSDLFTPFEQLHTNRQGGAGLGLAISSQLAKLMDGYLNVESEFGVGSTFFFSAPLETSDESFDEPEDFSEESVLGTGTVLVVEDNPVNQLLSKNQLEMLGYEAEIVSDGEAGVATVTNEHVAVLMDWNLPGIDGLEATRQIRQRSDIKSELPIIAMTANALGGDRDRCLAAGMNDFLAKPVSLKNLRSMLQNWAFTPVEAEVRTPESDETVNRNMLDDLVEQLGDQQVVKSLLDAFLQELPSQLEAITCFSSAHQQATRAAHTLGSTSALLGAESLSNACKELEQMQQSDGEAEVLVNNICTEADLVGRSFLLHMQNLS